jgi:hypothetical protein
MIGLLASAANWIWFASNLSSSSSSVLSYSDPSGVLRYYMSVLVDSSICSGSSVISFFVRVRVYSFLIEGRGVPGLILPSLACSLI